MRFFKFIFLFIYLKANLAITQINANNPQIKIKNKKFLLVMNSRISTRIIIQKKEIILNAINVVIILLKDFFK